MGAGSGLPPARPPTAVRIPEWTGLVSSSPDSDATSKNGGDGRAGSGDVCGSGHLRRSAHEPFLRKLDAMATRSAAVIVMRDPPQASPAPFWQAVHGEARLRLPCRDELVAALVELGITPEVQPLGPVPLLPLGPRKEANDCLVAGPGTPADARLLAVLDELTQAREGQLSPRDGPPHEAFLLRWAPGGERRKAGTAG
jgi:hypothetical protein